MNVHNIKSKRVFKLIIVLSCLFSCIFTLIACSNRANNKVDDNKPKEDIKELKPKITKVAFVKDNNAYIYNDVSKEIKSFGDNSRAKDLLTLSPDKTKLAFRYFNEEKVEYPPHVVIYDILKDNLTEIVVENKNAQQVVELKWIDNEDILIAGHINPSASGYVVYNIKSKSELISCVGTLRDVTLDKAKILYSSTPHSYPALKANLYINENKVYEAESDEEVIYDGSISKDGKVIAFRSWSPNKESLNGEVNAYLSIAKVSSDYKEINDIKKISISSDTIGEIEFDANNNVSIVGDEFIYKFNEGKIFKEQNLLPKAPELSTEQLSNFKKVLAKQFPDDSITEETVLEAVEIYNMVIF